MKILQLAIFLTACASMTLCAPLYARTTTAGTKAVTSKTADFTGDWKGVLPIASMPLVLHIQYSKAAGWSGTFDSPQQNAFGLKFDQVQVKAGALEVKFTKSFIDISLRRPSSKAELVGTFTQGGRAMPVTFSPGEKVLPRPQEPKPPFPYAVEEVTFKNKNGNVIAGTLTYPKTGSGPFPAPFPAIILICGSGPNTRDEPVFGHKPFLLLSDWFTRQGYAVLRYDKRGTGKSEGDFARATIADFADDGCAAFDFMNGKKEIIDGARIGLLGHSEGGCVAPMVVASGRKAPFVILLAGTAVDGYHILKFQQASLGEGKAGLGPDILEIAKSASGAPDLETKVTALLADRKVSGDASRTVMKQITAPWYLNFVQYDPAPTLKLAAQSCPVLAVFGEKDQQVPPSLNTPAVQKVIDESKDAHIEIVVIPGVNHLFQQCRSGQVSEYSQIAETMDPAVLKRLSEWAKAHDMAKSP